jgi:hypothetical protein
MDKHQEYTDTLEIERLFQRETVITPKKQIITILENIATSISAFRNALAKASNSDND